MPAAQHLTNGHGFHKSGLVFWVWTFVVAAAIWGCAPQTTMTPEQQKAAFIAEHSKGAIDPLASKAEQAASTQLPVRYQNPSYSLKAEGGAGVAVSTDAAITVGAKITPSGPKPLHLVMQELAKLKAMNVSWANDVDKGALVNVTIMPDEDFFEAIDSVLRQLDYFHEMDGNTIVVKHKETKKYLVAMPFTATSYSTGVGGDVLGKNSGTSMTGNLNLKSNDNKFDIWTNIEKNIDVILEKDTISVETAKDKGKGEASARGKAAGEAKTEASDTKANGDASASAEGQTEGQRPKEASTYKAKGRGYYTIDRPIGLITVTAPRSYQNKIANYINGLKGEMYRQVSIEAKIIEVTLSNDNTTGLDWGALSSLGTTTVGLGFDFGGISISQGGTLNTDHDHNLLSLSPSAFNVIIDLMKKQGHVEILSNPKISVMNGQPAMISVGQNVTYIKDVSSKKDALTGDITTTATPDSVMSGLGMGVIATIMENDQIILALTPVTSELTQPIEYLPIGNDGGKIGLPQIQLREMSTMVRVKNGEMLVVGGLTDTSSTYNNDSIAGLGEIPNPVGKLFKKDGTNSVKKELIILMRPKIISF